MKSDYKAEIVLPAPDENEPAECRARIFALVERMQKAVAKAKEKNLPQNTRDFQIHELHWLARRLVRETGS